MGVNPNTAMPNGGFVSGFELFDSISGAGDDFDMPYNIQILPETWYAMELRLEATRADRPTLRSPSVWVILAPDKESGLEPPMVLHQKSLALERFVPEPTSVVLLIVGGTALLLRCRRRSRSQA